jgi:hypothetical protein
VNKEAYRSVGELVPDHPREEQQVIVVNPNEVARLVDLDDAASKCGVCFCVEGVVHICRCVFRGDVLPEEIVKEWPQD